MFLSFRCHPLFVNLRIEVALEEGAREFSIACANAQRCCKIRTAFRCTVNRRMRSTIAPRTTALTSPKNPSRGNSIEPSSDATRTLRRVVERSSLVRSDQSPLAPRIVRIRRPMAQMDSLSISSHRRPSFEVSTKCGQAHVQSNSGRRTRCKQGLLGIAGQSTAWGRFLPASWGITKFVCFLDPM